MLQREVKRGDICTGSDSWGAYFGVEESRNTGEFERTLQGANPPNARVMANCKIRAPRVVPKLVAPLQGVTEESHVDRLGRNDLC